MTDHKSYDLAPGRALPGGFFTPDDKNLDVCASRELQEETSVTDFKLLQFGIYS